MASGESASGKEPARPQDLAQLLEELKQTPAGIVIYDQLIFLLEDWQKARNKMDGIYVSLISFLMDSYAKNPSYENITQINASLIDARMASTEQAESLSKKLPQVENIAANVEGGNGKSAAKLWPESSEQVMKRLVESLTSTARSGDPDLKKNEKIQDRREVEDNNSIKHGQDSRQIDDGSSQDKEEKKDDQQDVNHSNGQNEKTYPEVERRVNSAYRLHLDRKHNEIEKLQEALSQKAEDAIAQNKEFGALLEIERSALEQANGVEEIEDLKEILIDSTNELIKGQRDLSEKLFVSMDYLKLVKSDSERLHDELNKVRLLSLTDEFTGLPNRRAFMRQLEDEIGRTERYKTPLALAIIDLDEFKLINDNYGHAAGDKVLNWFANDVLSIFRHHDMVARYGGEEFAVIFPNTDQKGALRALHKIRTLAANSECDIGNMTLAAPTFSTGLTFYAPGETPSMLIDRADKALYRAKRLGRDRIEMVPLKPQLANGPGSN